MGDYTIVCLVTADTSLSSFFLSFLPTVLFIELPQFIFPFLTSIYTKILKIALIVYNTLSFSLINLGNSAVTSFQ